MEKSDIIVGAVSVTTMLAIPSVLCCAGAISDMELAFCLVLAVSLALFFALLLASDEGAVHDA